MSFLSHEFLAHEWLMSHSWTWGTTHEDGNAHSSTTLWTDLFSWWSWL